MADRTKVLRLLKTARGQLDGILKMVEEDRYCIDISQQVMAAHLRGCVQQAATAEDREEKVEELVSTLDKILK